MARVDQSQSSLAGVARASLQHRLDRALRFRQPGLAQVQVDLAQADDARIEAVGVRGDLLAQRAQDALNLVLFFELELTPAIVQVDGRERLDVDGLAAGGLIVNDPPQLASGVRSDRHDVASLAHGYERLLEG